MNELLPCPFCGSKDIHNVSSNHSGPSTHLHYGDTIFAVNCGKCGASVPNRYRNELVIAQTECAKKCQADMYADLPRDCDYPFCGCDPVTNKVMSDLQEMGLLRDKLERSGLAQEAVAGLLKGIGKINGDGYKDVTELGELVIVLADELPSPYAPGQYTRLGNPQWTASNGQYDFTPATVADIHNYVEKVRTSLINNLAKWPQHQPAAPTGKDPK